MTIENFRENLPWPSVIDAEEGVSAVEYLYEREDGKTCSQFSHGLALAALLLSEAAYIEELKGGGFGVGIITSDVFMWGCSDSEAIKTEAQLEDVYRYFAKDHDWGCAVWAMVHLKEMPQRPVEKRIRDAGIWDLDALKAEHGLRCNHYDGISHVLAKRKYEACCGWCEAEGRQKPPFDAKWWSFWKEYTAANPGWNDEAWQIADAQAADAWRRENGFPTRETDGAAQ